MNTSFIKSVTFIKVCLLLSLLVHGLATQAYDVEVDGICYDVDMDKMEATVVAGDYAFKHINIPERITIQGRVFFVTTIGNKAFYCETPQITTNSAAYALSITIPHSIKYIMDYAFGGTKYLKKLVLPNSIEKIDPINTFRASDSIVIEDGTTSLEFKWHKNFYLRKFWTKYIYIGRDVKSIQYGAETWEKAFWGLAGCNDIETIEYGDNVTAPLNLTYDIGYHNIYGMNNLKTVILGKNIKGMFEGYDIPSLTTIISRSDNPRGFNDTNTGFFTNQQYLNLKLYVPIGSKEKYANTEGWKKFFNIEEAELSPVKIIVNCYTRFYGEGNPIFEYTYEGAKLIGEPEIVCYATKESPVGIYPIKIGNGSIKNLFVNYIEGTLNIQRKPLDVSVGNYVKKQGDENPVFTIKYDGFVNNEDEDVLLVKPKAKTSVTKSTEPGEYPITLTNGDADNYELTYHNGKLIVLNADPVTITAKSYIREYGVENPTLEYDAIGAMLKGSPKITCEATIYSPVGIYPIIIEKGSVTNYNDTYVNGTLTITKTPLSIIANNYTIKQGDELPAFEVTYSGFKNNETEAVMKKKPMISCNATSLSKPGTYEIVVKGAEAENYEINYVSGTLTITDPPTYMLTYMIDGKVYKSYEVKYLDAITPETVPIKEGYTFNGWSEIPTTMPAHDVTVTGSFTVNKYKLIYVVDGNVYKTVDVEYGSEIYPIGGPEKEGYTFVGWENLPEETMPAHDVTVIGTFAINSYKVTFMYGDNVLTTIQVKYGEKIELPTSLNSERYTLIEWLDVPETMPAQDITIYADYVDGINDIITDSRDAQFILLNGIYTLDLRPGLNIIRMKDGITKKVMVK